MGLELARGYLQKARDQWDKAAVASWSPPEPAECVTYAFYAYENSVVAVAEALGRKWKKDHYKKAELAAGLAKEGLLKTDIGDLLLHLNDLRKDISYGVPGPDLTTINLEELVAGLERFLDDVTGVIDRADESETEL